MKAAIKLVLRPLSALSLVMSMMGMLSAVVLAGVAVASAFAAAPAAASAACPNEALRAEARSTQLPECRAYELVSPVDTADSGVLNFYGAAPGGEAAEFVSAGGFAGIQSDQAINAYIARRGSEGWETASVGIPGTAQGERLGWTTSFDLTKQVAGVEFKAGENAGLAGMLFSGDLAAAPALQWVDLPQFHYLETLPNQFHGYPADREPEDTSPDLSHLVLYGPEVENSNGVAVEELYEISGVGTPAEAAQPISIGPKGETIDHAVSGNGAGEGNGAGGAGADSIFHAISNDGAVIFFTAGISYVRVNGETAHPITLELGGGVFQGASEDGSKVFLHRADGALYMDLIDSEPGHEAVSETVPIAPAGQSNTYLRFSDDGSRVYFLSTGVIAGTENEENENKEKAEEHKPNLYVYDTLTKKTAFIAQAEPGRSNASGESQEYEEMQVNGCPSAELGEAEEPGCEDGRFFVFTSTAHITPGDTARSQQVFEYDAKTGHLVRVSTGEGGYAENGNSNALGASIPKLSYGTNHPGSQEELFEDKKRAVSDDGSTVVFSTSGALSPRAVNDLHPQPGPLDIYESHNGQVSLISTGHSLTSDEQPTITPSGRDIFFTSTEGILPQDSDGLSSLYDARIGGGFPAAAVPAGGCNGDACQGPPSVPNLLAAPASATFSGLGNPTPEVASPGGRGSNPTKTTTKTIKCKKGFTKKKNKCVKSKPKKKTKTAKKAGHNGRVES